MRALISNFLEQDCKKLIDRHFDYLRELNDYAVRRGLREGQPFAKEVKTPHYWQLNPAFDPFKVRTSRKLKVYSHTLARKIKAGSYEPAPALKHSILKENGARRVLNIFPLPDAAISRLVYKSLLHKNAAKLSGYAYAYREDRSAHHAVSEIFAEWKTLKRVFVAEYDFTGFFDNIEHKYLWEVLERHGFICTPSEKKVIDSFLKSKAAPRKTYPAGAQERVKGIPQGTSVSLFLANVACWELDRSLERLGVGFARYADDTVIWSEDYPKVVQAYQTIEAFAKRMGVPINRAKSPGIHLLTDVDASGEIAMKHHIDFLGYRISLCALSIKPKKLVDIKKYISFLIYQNLLQPMKKGIYNTLRLAGGVDGDYVTTLRQVRAYLYGGLTDEKLRGFITGRIPSLNFRGVMSYYPMANDARQFAILDAWLRHTLKQSLRLREKLWAAQGTSVLPGPRANWIEGIENLGQEVVASGARYDFTVPSFALINRAMRVAITRKGIQGVVRSKADYY
jgi:hypothetical protein